jgi:hypothetical protein
MRRITLKIAVAFLAFVIGIAFTAFWFISPQPLNEVLKVSTDAVVTEESEEYAVYSAAINHLFVKDNDSVKLLAISNQTSFYGNETHKAIYGSDYIKDTASEQRVKQMNEWYPSVTDETLFDYDKKKIQSSNLHRNFNLSVGYTLINEEELENVGKHRIEVFSEKYEASGMIKLSKIGFNKGKTEAFVYVEFLFCPLCSQSDHLLLEKVNGIWTVKEIFEGMRS